MTDRLGETKPTKLKKLGKSRLLVADLRCHPRHVTSKHMSCKHQQRIHRSTTCSSCCFNVSLLFLPLIYKSYLRLFSFHNWPTYINIQDECWVNHEPNSWTQHGPGAEKAPWPASTSSKPSKRGMAQSQSDSLINLEEKFKNRTGITCWFSVIVPDCLSLLSRTLDKLQ